MLVSTTLAGPGAEDSIVEALRSCSHLVSYHLIALSGASAFPLQEAIDRLPELAKKVIYRAYEWPNSYGEARTEMLRWAESFGATWALTVDCDERLELDEVPHEAMAEHWLTLAVLERGGGYSKPRWLRCGAGLQWVGDCCERLLPEESVALVDGRFWELEKTEEQEQVRMERGVSRMPGMLAKDDHPQWIRHYAECLLGTGDKAGAEVQLQRLLSNPRANREARSWAHFRLAQFEIQRGDFEQAQRRAALGIAQDPGYIQEFGALLAFIAGKQGRGEDAIMWATYALEAPVDLRRGGHRGLEWRTIVDQVLKGAHMTAAPQEQAFTAETFQEREERFSGDYKALAKALTEVCGDGLVLDMGAGTGLLVRHMPLVMGIETSEVAREQTPPYLRSLMRFAPLEQWAGCMGDDLRAHLVCCVEVAEHIPAERADELVDAVCSNASRWIYWSAAHPGQGGLGHVNEQPRAYWEEKFKARGWRVDWGATEDFLNKISGLRQCWWLKENALLLRKF